jgi:hypothetical protein
LGKDALRKKEGYLFDANIWNNLPWTICHLLQTLDNRPQRTHFMSAAYAYTHIYQKEEIQISRKLAIRGVSAIKIQVKYFYGSGTGGFP